MHQQWFGQSRRIDGRILQRAGAAVDETVGLLDGPLYTRVKGERAGSAHTVNRRDAVGLGNVDQLAKIGAIGANRSGDYSVRSGVVRERQSSIQCSSSAL